MQIYGNSFHQVVIDEIELGERVSRALDNEASGFSELDNRSYQEYMMKERAITIVSREHLLPPHIRLLEGEEKRLAILKWWEESPAHNCKRDCWCPYPTDCVDYHE